MTVSRARVIVPLSGDWSPVMISSRVVLPAPFGPDDREPTTGADHQADVAEEMLGGVALRHARERHEGHGPEHGSQSATRRAPDVSNRSLVAMPGTPAAFHAFSTAWALGAESQIARTVGPAPERQAPAAPRS